MNNFKRLLVLLMLLPMSGLLYSQSSDHKIKTKCLEEAKSRGYNTASEAFVDEVIEAILDENTTVLTKICPKTWSQNK